MGLAIKGTTITSSSQLLLSSIYRQLRKVWLELFLAGLREQTKDIETACGSNCNLHILPWCLSFLLQGLGPWRSSFVLSLWNILLPYAPHVLMGEISSNERCRGKKKNNDLLIQPPQVLPKKWLQWTCLHIPLLLFSGWNESIDLMGLFATMIHLGGRGVISFMTNFICLVLER